MKNLPLAFALTVALALSGCGKDILTPFGALTDEPIVDIGKETRGPTGTDVCQPDANGAYNEGVNLTSRDEDKFIRADGGGCIKRNIKDVWAAALNQNLMVWNSVDESKLEERTPPAVNTHYFHNYYQVNEFIKVKWFMDWYHSVKRGTPQDPQTVLINYKKTEGTSYIPYLEGAIRLEKVNEQVTSFRMGNQIKATRQNQDDVRGAVNDVYVKLQTGEPDRSKLP